MAAPSPAQIIESVQKVYEVAKAIRDHVAMYKNIGPRLNILSMDLLATGDLVSKTPLADTSRNYIIKDHLETFIKEAECVVKVLQAQKKSIFGKLRTFAFAGSINSQIDELDASLIKFQQQYKLMQLDNLASHVALLPSRIATAMKDAEKTATSLQNASPTDLVNMIADPQAREFWQKNFKVNIVVKEDELKKAFRTALDETGLYAATDLNKHFDAIWNSVTDDMDANNDEWITIFEYRTYVEDGNLLEQWESLWLAAGQSFTRKVAAAEESVPTIKKQSRRPPQGLTPQIKIDEDLAAQVKRDSHLRKKASKEMGLDVAFVVDCTSSMGEWIATVKDKLDEIHTHIATEHPLARQRFAFVGYRDFNDGDARFSTHPFTASIDTLKKFVQGVKAEASGKTDTPEDVLGGLKNMLRLNWLADVRVAILLGDAPCHGAEYYNPTDPSGNPVPAKKFDYYPDKDPENNSHQAIVEQIAEDKVHFVMCRIPNSGRGVITDIMIKKFKGYYDGRTAKNGWNSQAQVVDLQAKAHEFVHKVLDPMNKALDESEVVSLHSRTSLFSGVIPSTVPKAAAPKHLHQRVDTPIPKLTPAAPSLLTAQIDSGVIPSSVPKVTARRAPAELTVSDEQIDSGVIPSTVPPKQPPKGANSDEQLDSVLPSTVPLPAGHKVYPSADVLLATPPTRPTSKSPTHKRP